MRSITIPTDAPAMAAPEPMMHDAPGSDCLARLARGEASALSEVYVAFSAEVHQCRRS